ncbi:MAG: MtnX-like HAD-IB family phosphatase [Candidatus Omnitrophica bacterium]|nr:MtnX-like HAD-IB family phosphatase [Candidatus Omnitrophota bacterium]
MKRRQYQIFFDFDNTITSFDVLDEIIRKYSINNHWQFLEEEWEKGRIGSKECLAGQLKNVRISKNALRTYLSSVRVEPYFRRILAILRKKNIKVFVVSDSFLFIIKNILRNNAISPLPIYANKLLFKGNKLKPLFAHRNNSCSSCAHCKKNTLLSIIKNDKINIYIGDGLSDICAAQNTQLVFAKGRLLEYFLRKKRDCIPFCNLKEVYRQLKKTLQ